MCTLCNGYLEYHAWHLTPPAVVVLNPAYSVPNCVSLHVELSNLGELESVINFFLN